MSGNRFTVFADVTFTKGSRSLRVDGFYDGGDTWRARFMPDEEGSWSYVWSLSGAIGNGSFVCTARANPDNHGHVHRDPYKPRYLVCDDGTAHYWYGGKWINVLNYGPQSKGGETNNGPGQDRFYSDAVLLDHLDELMARRHNGLLLKTSLFPLENDKLSWDLPWIRRGEWLVEQMAARGIYCQINFFDTWSRDRNYWFKFTTDGAKQVFNVWASGDESAKENYIRTLVARYAGYYNVYWELGNEMEHSPNSGSAFVSQANSKYIPWIRQYDPYGLPIGLSENVWKSADVDIGFLHQTDSLPAVNTSGNRPNIMNEPVFGWTGGALWLDSTIRNSANRLGYRRTFWRMFTYGGAGSSEATWLYIDVPLNSAVLTVMDDHARLRDILESLPTHINDMDTDTGFVISGPGEYRTRRQQGNCYVTYFLLAPGQSSGAGNVTVSLPAATYNVDWYDPKTGAFVSRYAVSASGSTVLPHPSFTEDIVLLAVNASLVQAPEPAAEPSPADESVGVATTPVLSWLAGAGAASHVVYFGTSDPPPLARSQFDTSFAPGPLAMNTTYYWRVDEVNSGATTRGQVWRFTTTASDLDGDGDGDQEDFGVLQRCLTAPGWPMDPGCEDADLDHDGFVDQGDLAILGPCMNGPNTPPGC